MHANHTPFWDAKNRYGLPDEMDFSFSEIAHIFTDTAREPESVKPAKAAPKPAPKPAPAPEELPPKEREKKPETAMEEDRAVPTDDPLNIPEKPPVGEPDARIPKELRDLMIKDNIGEWDIQNIVQEKGFFPSDMPIWDYPRVPDDFIAYLVSVWPQMVDAIRKASEEIPFD